MATTPFRPRKTKRSKRSACSSKERPKKPKNGLVTDLRTGKLDTITSRLVVDVTKPVAIRSAFTLPASASAKNRLVIDFQVVSANTTTDEKKKFFGELEQQPAINPAAKTTNVNAKIAAPQKIATQTNTITHQLRVTISVSRKRNENETKLRKYENETSFTKLRIAGKAN